MIAADLPIGVFSHDAIAQGDGPARGRELEIAGLLSFMKHAGVANTVWITADMHYTAANYYDPNRAVFQDFDPFWEFISGPIHAGTWAPGRLDNTFGPRAVFELGCGKGQPDNLAPCFGLQFFGHVAIDGETEVMTVTLKDVNDRTLVVESDRAGVLQRRGHGHVAGGPDVLICSVDRVAALSWNGGSWNSRKQAEFRHR